ncbi:MAG TPA: HNH endonuclease [Leptolyngbyaceae cyanobacterium]
MPNAKPLPPVSLVNQLVTYDPATGEFARRDGKKATRRTKKGYLQLVLKDPETGEKFTCYAHRLAWLLVTGDDPGVMQVDHRDRDKENNRFDNLRLATPSQNSQNVGLRRSNKSGVIGVCWDDVAKQWQANIRVDGRQINLGSSPQKEVAISFRREAERFYYGEFAPATRLTAIRLRD